MHFKEYAEKAAKTVVYPKDVELEYLLLGLTSEVGEVVDIRKKVLRDMGAVMKNEQRRRMLDELSDVLWYWTRLVLALGGDPDIVAQLNLDKLADRQNRGVLHGSGDNR